MDKENNLDVCAIVKYAENDCKRTNGLRCDGYSCSFFNKKFSNASKFGFWYQDYFDVKTENIEIVNKSHLNRFTCIRKNGTGGLEDRGLGKKLKF